MVILLQTFQLNLAMTLFHIQTPPPIKSIDDDEMDHLLEFFHSEHDDDLLDVDLQMLQA